MKVYLIFLFALLFVGCSKNKAAGIHFANDSISFSVKKGDTFKAVFNFKNIGNDSLEIINVQASCGCTTVNYPKQAIPSDSSGIIEVIYNSEHEEGMVVSKKIVVQSNTKPILHVLSLVGQLSE